MQPGSDTSPGGIGRQLRRWGPVVGIVVVAAVIAVVVALSGGDDDEPAETRGRTSETPEGTISFSRARQEGLEVTFGPNCDEDTGRVAIPYHFAPECYANADDNGGKTSRGVTADTIKVVVYLAQESDPVVNFITSAVNADDTNAQLEATYRGYKEFFEANYQTYGRKVELVFLTASGVATDEVAARADAVKAAEMGAFAVWASPILTNAWTDELAARGVICLGCSASTDPDWYLEREPYVFNIAKNGTQTQTHLTEYLSKQVAGRKAVYAGDPAFQQQDRRFGYLYIETSEQTRESAERLRDRLAAENIELAAMVPYTLDPTRLQEQAASAIAKLKDAGVTSVIFSGDPVAPATFTREASAQAYFPEWVLTGSALVDTTAFARTYDQQQWAHAFGVSNLVARIAPRLGSSWLLYEWFHGEPPPADDVSPVLFPQPALFYAAIQAAGPNLTPETFRDGLFTLEPTPNVVTQPSISFGEHDIWDHRDYNGVDDSTEVWWDPGVSGPDEIRKEGQGMYRYVEGGRRYLPGQWPERDTLAFTLEGSITIYDEPPAEEQPKDYPPPRE